MARKQNKSPIKKTNTQSSINSKKGGKVTKQPKTDNVKNKNVDNKAKCVKCSKYITKINKTQGKMCSLCLKKEVNVKSINVTVSVTPKRKSTRCKENIKKSNAKSNPTNSPSTSKQQNSSKVVKTQLSSPKNVKNNIRGKKNESVYNKNETLQFNKIKGKNNEPPALKQSEKNVSLRGRKRSYGQLSSGMLNNETSAKKTRTAIKKDNLRTIRNKKPTVKGSEWINTINLKKISVPQKDTIKSKTSPKNKSSPSKKATKSISPKNSEATNTKAKTRGAAPRERVKEYTKSIPKKQVNKNDKIAPKKHLKPSPLKANTRVPKIKNSSKLTQKITNISVKMAEKQQRSKLRHVKKKNEEIPLNDNLSKSIRNKFSTCFTKKNIVKESGLQENVQIVSEILHDILNSVGNDVSVKCDLKINDDTVLLECANAEKLQLDNEKGCLSKLEDVKMKENMPTKDVCQKSITSNPIADISYGQLLEDETKFKKMDTNESGGVRDSSLCSSNNDIKSVCASDRDIHVQNIHTNEKNGIHVDDVKHTSFEGLLNTHDMKDNITNHKNVTEDMKLSTDTSNNEPHNSEICPPGNVANLEQDNSSFLQAKEYDTERRLNTSINGTAESSNFQTEELKSKNPVVTSIVETIKPINENSSSKIIINNKDEEDSVALEVNVDLTMPEVADENKCKSENVLVTVTSEQYNNECKQLANGKLPNIVENCDDSSNKGHLSNKGNDGSSTHRGCDNNIERGHGNTILMENKDIIAMESDVLIDKEYDDVNRKIDVDSTSLESDVLIDNEYDDVNRKIDVDSTSIDCHNSTKEINQGSTHMEFDDQSTIEETCKTQIGQKEDILTTGCDNINKDDNTHIGQNEDNTLIENIDVDNPDTKQIDNITEQNEDDTFKEHIDVEIQSTKQNNYIAEKNEDNKLKEHFDIQSTKQNEENSFNEHIDIDKPKTKQDNYITPREFDESQNEENVNNSGTELTVDEATLKFDKSNENSVQVFNEESNDDNKLQSSDNSIFKGKEDNVPDNITNRENVIDVLKGRNNSSQEDQVSNHLERERNGIAECNDKIKELGDNSISEGREDTTQKEGDSCLREVGGCESTLNEHDNDCSKEDDITDVTSTDNVVPDSKVIITQKNSTDHLLPEKISNSNISIKYSNSSTSIQHTSGDSEARVIEENDGNKSINIETITDGNARVFHTEDVNDKAIFADGKIKVNCDSIESKRENGKIAECVSSIEKPEVNSSMYYDNNHSSVNINNSTISRSKDEKYCETEENTDFTLYDSQNISLKSNNETVGLDDENKTNLGNSNIPDKTISNFNSCTTSTENLNNDEEINDSVETNINKNDLNKTIEKKEDANLSGNELSFRNSECLNSSVRMDNIKNTGSLEDSKLQEEHLSTNVDINSHNETTNVVDDMKIIVEDDNQISLKNKKIDCGVTSSEGKGRESEQSFSQTSSHITSLSIDSETPGLDNNASTCNKEENELPTQLETEDKNFNIKPCDKSGIVINLESSLIKEENDEPIETQPTSELSNNFPKEDHLTMNIKHTDEESDNYMEVDVGEKARGDDTQFKSHTEDNITSTISHLSVDKVKVQSTSHDSVKISSSIETTEEDDNTVIKIDSNNGTSCDNSDANCSKSDENNLKMEVS